MKKYYLALSVLIYILVGSKSFGASYTFNQTTIGPLSGGAWAWNSNATWSPSTGFPVAGDIVTISSNRVLSTTTNAACSTLTVTSGTPTATISTSTFTLAISSTLTLSGGTLTLTSTSGTVTAGSVNLSGGSLTLNSSGKLAVTGAISISNLSSNLTILNTLTPVTALSLSMTNGNLKLGNTGGAVAFPTVSSASLTGGTVTYSSNGASPSINTTYNYNNLIINSPANLSTYSLSSNLNVLGSLGITNLAAFSPGAFTVSVGGNISVTTPGINIVTGTSTFILNGTSAQTLSNINLYNLYVTNTSGTNVIFPPLLGIAHDLITNVASNIDVISNSSTINYNGSSNQIIGTNFENFSITISNSNSLALVTLPSSPTLKFTGDFTSNSTFDALTNNAIVEITGVDVIQNISGGTFYDLTVGTSFLVGGTLINFNASTSVSNTFSIGQLTQPGLSGFINAGGNLIIANNASLLDYNSLGSSFNSLGGNVIFQRTTASIVRKYFLSSPVATATVDDLKQGQTFGVLKYDTDSYVADQATVSGGCASGGNGNPQNGTAAGLYKTEFGSLTPGRGYSLKQSGTKTMTFNGIPNYGSVNVTSFANGTTDRTLAPYNWCPNQNHLVLLGNPYPCAIDWDKLYTNSSNSLVTYAKVYNGSGYIDLIAGSVQPIRLAQGFFTQVINPGTVPSTLFQQNTWLSNSSNGALLRKESPKVRTTLIFKDKTNSELYDELNIVFNDEAKDEIELKYDAIDWKGEPEVPSMTALQSNGEYSTLQFPTPSITKKIPLALDIEHASEYLLTAKIDGSLPNDLILVLIDKKNKKETILEKDSTVKLVLPKGYNASQYEIQYRTGYAVSSIESNNLTSDQFFVSSTNGIINVDYNETFNSGSITIYDINGKLLTQKLNISTGNAHYEFSGFNETNCFLIKLVTENGVKTKKVITK